MAQGADILAGVGRVDSNIQFFKKYSENGKCGTEYAVLSNGMQGDAE